MPTATPNQDTNAGNQGDVWKHRTLLSLASCLLDKHDSSQPFRYFESHAGKGVYLLRNSKDARKGIQAVADHFKSDEERYLRTESDALGRGEYLGSWKLIAELLSARGVRGHFQLCEKDASVLETARSHAGAEHDFQFRPVDGFRAAAESAADLYLIDPFDSWPRSASIAQKLAEKNLLVWYAVAANSKPNELVQKTGLVGLEVLWSPIHTNASPFLRGCGLLLSRSLQALLPPILGDSLAFSSRLGWQLHLRVPWEIAQRRLGGPVAESGQRSVAQGDQRPPAATRFRI